MKSGVYSTDPNDHVNKKKINEFVFKKYARGESYKYATILPSVTCDDVRMCHDSGLYDLDTKFRIIEKGISGITISEYVKSIEGTFNSIFGINRPLSKYCELIYKRLEDCFYGILPQYSSVVDFAYYDTCSTFSTVNQWLPKEVKTLKNGAPVLMTFSTDYRGRNAKLDYEWLNAFNPVKGKTRISFESGRFRNNDCLNKVNDRVSRLIGYLQSLKILVNNAWLYSERKSYASMMVFIDGIYIHV